MVGVLVVDDEVLIRGGIAAIMRATPGFRVVGEAADGQTAVSLASSTAPDVILMDIRMPGLDGIAATRQILAASSQPKVLMLTTFDLDEYVYEALRAGACGFLLKDTEPQRLVNAVTTVASGDMLFAPTVVTRLIGTYAHTAARDQDLSELADLTEREREVLRMVGKGMSNAEIAGNLIISVATVKTHINRMMSKLGLTSRAQAVVLAYEAGLVTPRKHRAG